LCGLRAALLCAIVTFMKVERKFIKRKESWLLVLPAAVLAFWAFVLGRTDPPFPLDEAHIKERVTSQITQQLAGRSWKLRMGDKITFQKATVSSILIRPEAGRIHMRCRIDGWVQYPKQKGSFHWFSVVNYSLMATEFGSPHRGGINLPGYGRIHLSVPGASNDSRQMEAVVMARIQRGLCYHCGKPMDFFDKLSGKQRHDECQKRYESLYR